MKKILGLAATAAMTLSIVISSVASAAPLYCPDDMYADKVNGEWTCVNQGGGTPGGPGWHQGNDRRYR